MKRTLTLTHHDNSTILTFWDGGFIYISPTELERQANPYGTQIIDDGNHQGIFRSHTLVLLDMPDTQREGVLNHKIHQYSFDVNHAFKVVRILRGVYLREKAAWIASGNREWDFKKEKDVISLDRLQKSNDLPTIKTWMQIYKHDSIRDKDRFASTVLNFKKKIKPGRFSRLHMDLSNYVSRASIFPQGDEIYFDGRGSGCGFNGAFILHGDDYSIHT